MTCCNRTGVSDGYMMGSRKNWYWRGKELDWVIPAVNATGVCPYEPSSVGGGPSEETMFDTQTPSPTLHLFQAESPVASCQAEQVQETLLHPLHVGEDAWAWETQWLRSSGLGPWHDRSWPLLWSRWRSWSQKKVAEEYTHQGDFK